MIFRSAEDRVDPEGYEDVASEGERDTNVPYSSSARASVRWFVASFATGDGNFVSERWSRSGQKEILLEPQHTSPNLVWTPHYKL